MNSTGHLVAYAFVAILTIAGLALAPGRRRMVAFASIVLLVVITLMQPASPSGFTTANPTSSTLTIPETFQTPSQPATPTGFGCQWTAASTVNLSWSAASHSDGDVWRNTNGGSYSDYAQSAADGTFTYDDTSASSGTSNTYGYKVYAAYNSSSWESTNAAGPKLSTTCKDAIAQGLDGGSNPALSNPYGVAFDGSGDLFIADTTHHRIREIPAASGTNFGVAMTAGYTYTIAGDGTAGTLNDGTGASTAARVNAPRGVATDSAGDVFIADTANNAIRIIPVSNINRYGVNMTAGTLYTIAGNIGHSGNAADNVAAVGSNIASPNDIAVDSNGNVFFSDTGNNMVRELPNQATTQFAKGANMTIGNMYIIAGTGASGDSTNNSVGTSSKLATNQGIAVDSSGNVYISDKANNRVEVVLAGNAAALGSSGSTKGNLYQIVGTGTACGTYSGCGDGAAATSAKIASPFGIAIDASGNLLISDQGDSRMRMVPKTDVAGGSSLYGIAGALTHNDIYLFAGTGASSWSGDGYGVNPNDNVPTNITAPYGVAVDPTHASHVFVVDNTKNVIRELDTTNDIAFTAVGINGATTPLGDGTQAFAPGLSNPNHPAVDQYGNVFIPDSGTHTVREYVAAWGETRTVAGSGTSGSNGDGANALGANMKAPWGVAVDASENLYIADATAATVRKVTITGASSNNPGTIGNINAFAGNGNSCAQVSAPCGDGTTATSAKFNQPQDVAFDSFGDVLVSDTGMCAIRMIDTRAGTNTMYGVSQSQNNMYTVAGIQFTCGTVDSATATSGVLNGNDGITLDGSNNVYIADGTGTRVRELTSAGALTTTVGTNSCGANGNGGAATSATICRPYDVAWDSTTNALYIADNADDEIRCIATTGNTNTCGQGANLTTAGYIYLLAGTNVSPSDTGNGGYSANSTTVNAPVGVAIYPGGDLWVTQVAGADLRRIFGADP
jgi:sugar lactone lactonase YvrE